jgi:hypothetical protein
LHYPGGAIWASAAALGRAALIAADEGPADGRHPR